jgi:hypothetical protein
MASAGRATIWSGDSVGNWVLHSGNIYKAEWTPSNIEDDCQDWPAVCGGDSIYSPRRHIDSLDVAGDMYYDDVNDTLYIYPYGGGDPDVTGERMLASSQHALHFTPEGSYGRKHITIFGINFKMGYNGVLRIDENASGKADSCDFIHSNFAHNAAGFWGAQNNGSVIFIPGNTPVNPSVDLLFQACSIYSSVSDQYLMGSAGAGSGCNAYGMTRIVFDSCYFSLIPGSAVMWKGGNCECTGNTVRYCIIDGTDDMPFGQPTFTNYPIEHACGATNDSVYGNIIMNIDVDTTGPNYGVGIVPVDCTQETEYCGGDFIANNTFYNCNGFMRTGVDWGDTMNCSNNFQKIIVMHNLLQGALESGTIWMYDMNNGIFEVPSLADINYNSYYDPINNYIFKYYDGTTKYFDDWRTLGHDANGDTVEVTFDSVGAVNPRLGFARTGAPQEMYLYYGPGSDSAGLKLWTLDGAIQPLGGAEESSGPSKFPGMK